ncbi:MAG TPA: GspE/PulE family protein [Candidatus Binatia bacterium]|jgi:type IV pilus assembly protein PilB|nr:GspE/PulE family protein [Candidatus Binatia bacterium]
MDGNASAELLTILLEAGRITEDQYRTVTNEHNSTGKPVEKLLVEKKLVDEEFLARAKGTMLGIPYADLMGKDIPPQVLNLIPKNVAEANKAIPFEKTDDHVGVGLVDPRDMGSMQAIDFLAQNANFKPKYYIISNQAFTVSFKKYASIGKDVATALQVAKEKFTPVEKPKELEEKLEEVIKGAPVSRIVSVILRHAVDGGASDIHIEPFGDETRVRYRVDGVLRTSLTLPKYIHASLVARVKVLANLKLDETRVPQDGRITENIGGKIIDFRVSTMPLAETEKVVMRILDTTRGVPTLEQLGFRKQYIDTIKLEIRKPHGIFLITGPTGSGKSTTLFTILNMRNEEGVNISTLEDPVEYYIKGVNQSQIRHEVGYTFASGLRALLRQDPNIIMVGEIRDGETGELAIHAALTGHLIFSTLHTNDALGVVPRLIDMHVEPFLLSATINMAIAQRLARKICERCKAPIVIPAEVEAQVRKEIAEIPAKYMSHLKLDGEHLPFHKGRGCVRCGDSGYAGRVAVGEMIQYDEEMRALITKGFPMDEVQKVLRKQGAISLRQDGLLKALEGSTTIEEVMRITSE